MSARRRLRIAAAALPAALLLSAAAEARFEYIPPSPDAERPTLSLRDVPGPGPRTSPPAAVPGAPVPAPPPPTLRALLSALAPEGVRVRIDPRIDAERPAAADWPDLPSLLAGEGLAAERVGAALRVVPGDAAAPPPPVWAARRGELLSATLARWGERAGVEVAYLTDRQYRLGAGRTWTGSFAAAVQALLLALADQPQAPVGELAADGRLLSVLHRRAGGSARPERAPGEGADTRREDLR